MHLNLTSSCSEINQEKKDKTIKCSMHLPNRSKNVASRSTLRAMAFRVGPLSQVVGEGATGHQLLRWLWWTMSAELSSSVATSALVR
jgi:hypothetical protein